MIVGIAVFVCALPSCQSWNLDRKWLLGFAITMIYGQKTFDKDAHMHT